MPEQPEVACFAYRIANRAGAPKSVDEQTPFMLLVHPPVFSRRDDRDFGDPHAWNVTVDHNSPFRHVPCPNPPPGAAVMSDTAYTVVSKGRPWEHLLKPAAPAPLYCRQRGKYLLVGNVNEWNFRFFKNKPDMPFDWIAEEAVAERSFRAFFASDLARTWSIAIIKVFVGFNNKGFRFVGGIGRHLAMDILYLAGILPGTPVCRMSRDMQDRLLAAIKEYMVSLQSVAYTKQVCSVPKGLKNPFRFNDASNAAYFIGWVKCHHRTKVQMPIGLFLLYATLGYFDYEHVLGQPYPSHAADKFISRACGRNHNRVSTKEQRIWRPVVYRSDNDNRAGGGRGYWTPIVCKIPDDYHGSIMHYVDKDLAKFSFCTTIGPRRKQEKNEESQGGRPLLARTTHDAVTYVSIKGQRSPFKPDDDMRKYVVMSDYVARVANSRENLEKEKQAQTRAHLKHKLKTSTGDDHIDQDKPMVPIPRDSIVGTQTDIDAKRRARQELKEEREKVEQEAERKRKEALYKKIRLESNRMNGIANMASSR
ncbi:hypothetical protein HGRIS_011700 [Hohenbuehelia grisea]|uniref:Uncharacterized protein n=1 Tax=Hohenbuehelia grisea TaxID=104357 RepID=A0ABR3JWW5_9AGAR